MIPSDHFVRFYNEIFKYLERRGPDHLERYHQRIADKQCGTLLELFRTRGIPGMYAYWSRIRLEENCGMKLVCDGEDSMLLDMTACPSLSKVLDNDGGASLHYCDHCPGWILPLIDKAGFYCVYNMISRTEPVCQLHIFRCRKNAERCRRTLVAKYGSDVVVTNLDWHRTG